MTTDCAFKKMASRSTDINFQERGLTCYLRFGDILVKMRDKNDRFAPILRFWDIFIENWKNYYMYCGRAVVEFLRTL